MNLTLAREIVVGSYMGSDANGQVQIADNIGVGLRAGRLGFLDNLHNPAWGVNPYVHGNVSRVYSHLRPITDIKSALHTPFKNMLVPYLERKFANLLDPIMSLPMTDQLTQDQIKTLKDTLQDLDEHIGTGESILVTDSYGGDFGVEVTYGLSQVAGVQGQAGDQKVKIRRLQILKQASGKFQIYFDPGRFNSFSIGASLNIIQTPLVGVGSTTINGSAQTHFYTLDLNTESGQYANVIAAAVALREAMTKNSTSGLSTLKDIPDSGPLNIT